MKRTTHNRPRKSGKSTMMRDILNMLADPEEFIERKNDEMITAMLADIDQNMVDIVKRCVPDEIKVDQAFVDLMASSVYLSAISAPFEVLQSAGGAVNYGFNYALQYPEEVTPDKLGEALREGFGKISPTMANVMTTDMLLKTAKLLLYDWIRVGGSPNADQIKFDVHFYFDMMLQRAGKLDYDQMHLEGLVYFDSLSPDELAAMPPAIQNGITEFRKGTEKPQ